MPLVRLVAEGVGPFERLDLDLSDGRGQPHLGPHILAGVNGSGKSTVLRTIAWILANEDKGFDFERWRQLTIGHPHSRALLVVQWPTLDLRAVALSYTSATVDPALQRWVASECPGVRQGGNPDWFNSAAYASAIRLSHLPSPDLSKTLESSNFNAMAFESAVQNDAIQAWLLSLYSKRAIAREREQPDEPYKRSLDRFERALRLIYGEDVVFEVEIEPRFEPRLRFRNRSLNFSQLPDGIRSTVGWIADFMMRQDMVEWHPSLGGKRPGILLLDEIDTHLHPLWQRRLLPAMRAALPDVQIIVTSHSPFVISSCPGSRVHVLDIDERGTAHNRVPVDSPIGESVLTTLKEIFGVDSRFDIRTEQELNDWNTLKRSEVAGTLTDSERQRLIELTELLSNRSEELRSIVAAPATIPKSVLDALELHRV